jgi:hypothetical protein
MAIGYAEKIAGRYARVIDDGVDRWLQAVLAANNGTYTGTKFVQDVIAHSAEVGAAWSFTLESLFPPLNPLVHFEIKKTDNNPPPVSVAIPSMLPGPQVASNIVLLGPKLIPAANVNAVVEGSGDRLSVTLSGLQGIAPPLDVGLYTGRVQTAGANPVKIADVEVNVTA